MRSEKELKDRSFHEIKSQTAADRVAKLIKGVTGQLGPCGVTEPPLVFQLKLEDVFFFGYLTKFDIPLFLLLFDLEVYSTSKTQGKSVHHKSFPTLFSGAQIQRSLESSESDSSSDS